MDISQARRVLNAAREGADISKASLREALRLTGDLDSTWQPPVQTFALPSQQIKRDEPTEWQPRPWQITSDRPSKAIDMQPPRARVYADHLAEIKRILATPHGPIGMRSK